MNEDVNINTEEKQSCVLRLRGELCRNVEKLGNEDSFIIQNHLIVHSPRPAMLNNN